MTGTENTISMQDGTQRLTFTIRKMEPLRLEQWLTRALSLMVKDEDATEENYFAAGRKLAEGGIWKLAALPDQEAARELGDQLLACCSRVLDSMEIACTTENVNGFVQEVRTLFTLKNAALKNNLEFLLRAESERTIS